ncbi:hypothetical protein EV189_3728 [Motilibacter rhizosphaerae]|uniref:SMODS and SLOG-associating 2TM effector domain-containing protein n=1 Tax=Motilibacter rhizosphaerae TaxID=598652 RepID=A0A4V2F2R5_9ACTN|nr:hypothetical protein EV189_3728 [Motilibacter rhizosphaerae]
MPLEFRVGVTGRRYAAADPALQAVVDDELERIRDSLALPPLSATPVGITVVSPLAEGADRLVARAGLAAGHGLEVLLPLEPADYQDDFGSERSREEFRALLAAARSTTRLPPVASRDLAYLAAGQAVVARSDVLLALVDDRETDGVGGTRDVLDLAARAGVPVRRIRLDPSTGSVAADWLPDPVVPLRPRLSDEAVRRLDEFNSWVGDHAPSAEPGGSFGEALQTRWCAADLSALAFQRRFRLVSRLLYVLSPTAVAVVALQLVFELDRHVVWGEVVALALLVVTLAYARRAHLLERWVSARYLAERLRSAPYLALVGLAPFSSEGAPGGEDQRAAEDPADEWVHRALGEIWWHLPPSPPVPEVDELHTRLVEEWVRPQVDYHAQVAERSARRQHELSRLALALFALSLVAAVIHSAGLLEDSDLPRVVDVVSLLVPAVGGAVSGYAATRDFGRQALRSAAMSRSLRLALAELSSVQDLPALQRIVLRIDERMLGDSADWHRGERLHELELAG